MPPSAPHDVDRAMGTAGDPVGHTPLDSALDETFAGAADNDHVQLFTLGKFNQLLCGFTIFDDHFKGDIIFQRAFFDNIKDPAA